MTAAMPTLDLERRLATDRTLDIFSMTPKVDVYMCFPCIDISLTHIAGCSSANSPAYIDIHPRAKIFN
jgi:hypothetical protein